MHRLARLILCAAWLAAPHLAGAQTTMQLPHPPTAAQAFDEHQLLLWLKSLKDCSREELEARLPASFVSEQVTQFRVEWHAELGKLSRWFRGVDFMHLGEERVCVLRFVPNRALTRAKAVDIFGRLDPVPPPSPPPLGPKQGRVSNPVFDQLRFEQVLPDGRSWLFVFEPLERGNYLVEATLAKR